MLFRERQRQTKSDKQIKKKTVSVMRIFNIQHTNTQSISKDKLNRNGWITLRFLSNPIW